MPEPGHEETTLASLLGVVSDRYAVYKKFDSWLAVQGDAGPEDLTYDMYDLVEQAWVHEFGPLESRLELGLVD